MTNDKMFECQQMFRHACAFAEVADLAMEKFRHDTADIAWYSTPATVNSAFACEVFLKTLLESYSIQFEKLLKPKDRHKLTDLFNLLPEEAREWIKSATEVCYGGGWKDGFGFDRIKSISDAFVDWRYIYEIVGKKRASMQIDVGFLTAFRDALREACCRLFFGKTWEEYLAN